MTIIERWTSADLALFPDDPRLRCEIVDGELYVVGCAALAPSAGRRSPQPRARQLEWDVAALGEVASGPGIILEDDDNLIPDRIWISQARLALARIDDRLALAIALDVLLAG